MFKFSLEDIVSISPGKLYKVGQDIQVFTDYENNLEAKTLILKDSIVLYLHSDTTTGWIAFCLYMDKVVGIHKVFLEDV